MLNRMLPAALAASVALAGVGLADESSLEPTYVSAQQSATYDTTVLAYAEIVANHLGTSSRASEGLVGSKAPSTLGRLDLLTGALWEETTYRAAASFQEALAVVPQQEFDGDWTNVGDALQEPYRAICKLEIRRTDGSRDVGTGFLVGPQLVMTCKQNATDYTEIVVIPAAKGSDRPFGSATAVGSSYYEAPEGTAKYDIAWLFLPDKRLHNRVGYTFGLRALDDADLKVLKASVAGYPGARMKVDSENAAIKQVAQLQFYHDLDTGTGTRGAPVYSTKKLYAVGIQVLEAGTQVPHNQACRITAQRIQRTKELIREDTP